MNAGDTGWMLMCTALVFFMTPGLAFFYGGMVRSKHVVSTMYQTFIAAGVVGITWAIAGYSLSFSGDVGGFLGNFNNLFLNGVGQEVREGTTIPHVAFMMFQGMFAIITPALMVGAFAERVSFKAWLLIMGAWSLFVYSPVCHWVWGTNGWIAARGGLDFAGGLVVHTTAGIGGFVAALTFGRRHDFGAPARPYDTGLVLLGTALLWFGWFGFNAGSALAANGLAAHAFATTFFGAASAMMVWMFTDWIRKGKPTAMGAAIGAVVGLIAITPGAGFVSLTSSLLIGGLCGFVSNIGAEFLKEKLKLDDTLDVFACHGLGGMMGALLTGVFCSKAVNPAGNDGLLLGNSSVFMANLTGVVAVVAYTAIATYVIFKVVNMITPIRVSYEDESYGLDQSQHAELINANVEFHGKENDLANKEKFRKRA